MLAWQLTRLVSRSFSSGVIAPSVLETPMWIPQSTMLSRYGDPDRRALRAWLRDCAARGAGGACMPEWIELLLVFAVFFGLLAVGMQVPFAIGVPALLYLCCMAASTPCAGSG